MPSDFTAGIPHSSRDVLVPSIENANSVVCANHNCKMLTVARIRKSLTGIGALFGRFVN